MLFDPDPGRKRESGNWVKYPQMGIIRGVIQIKCVEGLKTRPLILLKHSYFVDDHTDVLNYYAKFHVAMTKLRELGYAL